MDPPGKRFWETRDLRRLFWSFVDPSASSHASLLLISKYSFDEALAVTYHDLSDRKYDDFARCVADEERRKMYLSAVRIVRDAHFERDEDITYIRTDIDQVISRYPNFTTTDCGTDSPRLLRTINSDGSIKYLFKESFGGSILYLNEDIDIPLGLPDYVEHGGLDSQIVEKAMFEDHEMDTNESDLFDIWRKKEGLMKYWPMEKIEIEFGVNLDNLAEHLERLKENQPDALPNKLQTLVEENYTMSNLKRIMKIASECFEEIILRNSDGMRVNISIEEILNSNNSFWGKGRKLKKICLAVAVQPPSYRIPPKEEEIEIESDDISQDEQEGEEGGGTPGLPLDLHELTFTLDGYPDNPKPSSTHHHNTRWQDWKNFSPPKINLPPMDELADKMLRIGGPFCTYRIEIPPNHELDTVEFHADPSVAWHSSVTLTQLFTSLLQKQVRAILDRGHEVNPTQTGQVGWRKLEKGGK
ncbi:hypothetical protein M231_04837 [Tremella mesenterica]|uniref:Uncharacterized protein n=1 Tax=Tremella mesenterica TaxID=5217 RepID=A0A4Q1BJF6_TREME|nr:hypothetical protein M231_04837 [Tremella mesenterica]